MDRTTPSVTRETCPSLDAKGVLMCYEFDEMYRKTREAEEARRKKTADDSKPSAPAKPAAPEVKPREPVPA
jgi:hypothetical protein